MIYTHRYIARIILEAKTALFVGSGENSLINDALVQRDHHGFPMIQGTSLTGVLRHALEDKDSIKDWESFFGFGKKEKTDEEEEHKGEGSKVKISSAYLLFPNGKIAEGLLEGDDYDYASHLDIFSNLPARQHVRITHRGVAQDNGLFENEVVYQGCRFLFEIELMGNENSKTQWESLLHQLKHPLFRIGQGTRNGYGNLSVESCKEKIFDLTSKEDFNAYLNFNPSLNAPNGCLEEKKDYLNPKEENSPATKHNLTTYTLEITPDDFFIFGSGYANHEVDNTPYAEEVLTYENGNFVLTPNTVIPASSIKGALRHRTCFYFNKLKTEPVFADKIPKESFKKVTKKHVGTNNTAVARLFGVGAGENKKERQPEDKAQTPQRGKIIIDDLFYNSDQVNNKKVFNHVAIDRFTGGAIDGALFSERVSQWIPPKEENISKNMSLNIFVENWQAAYKDKEEKKEEMTAIENALEESLKDICRGLLPLGGMTTKGHGFFSGTLFKNETQIYPPSKQTIK